MKRYIKLLTVLLSAAGVLAACQQQEADNGLTENREIRFSASVGHFNVKATDTAFETGDAVGLFAADPVSASNLRLTWDGNAMVPENTLYWGLNQEANETTEFYAYYPYKANTGKTFTFGVSADQTNEADFLAADLMLAASVAAPGDDAVVLNFAHRMARLVFYVDNRIDAKVTDVELKNVVLNTNVDLEASTLEPAGNATSVKALPAKAVDGSEVWAAIVPAQSVENIAVALTLDDGTVVELEGGQTTLAEGRSYSTVVILDQTVSSVNFNAKVVDWLDEYLYFGKWYDPGILDHQWYVDYDGKLIPMDPWGDGVFYTELVTGDEYCGFQLVKDDYAEVWGSAVAYYEPYLDEENPSAEYVLAANGVIYAGSETGAYYLLLDTQAKKLYLTMMDHEWVSLGTGIMIDGFVTDLFGLTHEEIEVEVIKDKVVPNVYRVVDPYKNWSYRDEFEWEEGAYLDFVVYEGGDAYISRNYLGLSYPGYGYIIGGSVVEENGWNYSYYGSFEANLGYFSFQAKTLATTLSELGSYAANSSGMMSLTLPGFTRPVLYDDVSILSHSWEQDPDLPLYIEADIKVGMDVKTIRYGVYSGHLASQDLFGKNGSGLCYTDVKENGKLLDFIPDTENLYRFDVPQRGTYTLVLYVENINGDGYGFYSHLWTWNDESTPEEPSLSVTTSASDHFPDIETMARVDFQDPSYLYILAVEESAFNEAGLTDGDIYDYTLTYGDRKSNSYISSVSGALYRIGDLKPQTTYRILAAGDTNYGKAAWAQATVTTDASPEFTSIGTGNYHDYFYNAFGPEGVNSEVEILQANDNENRYRVLAPYTEFWNANAESEEFSYAGFYSDCIDCLVDGDKFIYAPYYIGYYEPDMGPVQYNSYYYSNDYVFGYRNRQIQEGVYNIAPYAAIVGTRSYYNLSNFWADIYLEMPGYSYDAEDAIATRRAPGRKNNCVEASEMSVMAAQSEVLPFKRHMLNITATAIRTEVAPQFSAEPLK